MSAVGELVIGGDGFIGSCLVRLAYAVGTSRRKGRGEPHLDLLAIDEAKLPEARIVYLCAGVNGAMACEGSPQAYRVNVDAPIRLAQHYTRSGAFFVWISSTAVEWSGTAYARHKLTAETALRLLPGVGIVRPGRVLASNVEDLCWTMIGIGRHRREGITLWRTEEPGYAR